MPRYLWRNARAAGRLMLVVSCIGTLFGSSAWGQLGLTADQLRLQHGDGETCEPASPADSAVTYSLGGETLKFGLSDNRVIYAEWSNGRFTPSQVLTFLRRMQPTSARHVASNWRLDGRHMSLYPPVGRLIQRSKFIPSGGGLRSRQWVEVTEYYNSYQGFLGSQITGAGEDLIPYVTGIRRQYLAGRGVSRVVVVHDDGRALATFDLTIDSEKAFASTSRVFVADATTFALRTLAHLESLAVQPPQLLADYQWDGYNDLDYDKAAASYVFPPFWPWLTRYRTQETLVAAIDHGSVELSALTEYRQRYPKDELVRRLVRSLRRLPLSVQQRRATVLAEYDDDEAVSALVYLLGVERARTTAASALATIAARHPEVSASHLRYEARLWREWWAAVHRLRRT